MTSLGLLKFANNPYFEYFEFKRLMFLRNCLTLKWYRLMTGTSPGDLALWLEIFLVLELDRKAQFDLFLLAHSGEVGRTYANEVLWLLMSDWALEKSYRDLSNKVSHEVGARRILFDRPPDGHKDLKTWGWSLLVKPPWHMRHWSPKDPPQFGTFQIRAGPGGVPLAPPQCWAPLDDGWGDI